MSLYLIRSPAVCRAEATEKAVRWLRTVVGAKISLELNSTLTDLSVFAALGHYYANKLCGATELGLYNATHTTSHKTNAIACLQNGLVAWQKYTALATSQYTYPQLLARVALLDLQAFTENVEADIQIARDHE